MSSSSLQEIIACLGYPVAGNPTQFVMERAFHTAGVDSRCLTVDVPPEELSIAIGGMKAMGFRGAVLACPHQVPAIHIVDRNTLVADALGEIDLIHRDGEELVGDHTLVRASTELFAKHIDLAGKNALVIGSGELARGISLALGMANVARITLLAEEDSDAEVTSELLRQNTASEVQVQAWLNPYVVSSDTQIIVSARNEQDLPIELDSIQSGMVLMDTIYQSPRTKLIQMGEQAGCMVINGLDLLVQRASVAFHSWTGMAPDAAVVREAFEEFLMI